MKKIIAICGNSVSAILCCIGAWKICEAGNGHWIWFLLAAILMIFMASGLAQSPDPPPQEFKL